MSKLFITILRNIFHFDLLYVYKVSPSEVCEFNDVNISYNLNDRYLSLYKGTDFVHNACYSLGGCYISEIGKEIHIPNSFYIYNCVTTEGFRGKGYYKNALYFLINKLKTSNDVYICALRSNQASISTIEKVGFKLVGHVTFVNVFLFKLILKTKVYDEKVSFL